MQSIYPSLRYRDARAAVDWLQHAFGLEATAVHEDDDGVVVHAELRWRDSLIMIGTERETDVATGFGRRAGYGWLYVVVDDPDAHCDRARAAGADVFRRPEDQPYGSRDYSCRDLEGNVWSFGTYDPSAAAPDA